jgi:hypothetical protein
MMAERDDHPLVAYPQAYVADLHMGQELMLTGRVLPEIMERIRASAQLHAEALGPIVISPSYLGIRPRREWRWSRRREPRD